jgi:hypothetical protein
MYFCYQQHLLQHKIWKHVNIYMTKQNNVTYFKTEHLICNILFAIILSCNNLVCLASVGINYSYL